MITKTKSPTPGFVRIIFELPSCLWADHVCLIGEFNGWNPATMPMCQDRDGVWRIELDLPCSRTYQFRYLVDGHWLTDSHADGLASNPYGAHNSVVETTLPIAMLQFDGGKKQENAPFWRKPSHLAQVD